MLYNSKRNQYGFFSGKMVHFQIYMACPQLLATKAWGNGNRFTWFWATFESHLVISGHVFSSFPNSCPQFIGRVGRDHSDETLVDGVWLEVMWLAWAKKWPQPQLSKLETVALLQPSLHFQCSPNSLTSLDRWIERSIAISCPARRNRPGPDVFCTVSINLKHWSTTMWCQDTCQSMCCSTRRSVPCSVHIETLQAIFFQRHFPK